MVSVEAPESVLLEVAGSLKLFGSLEAIKAKLREELARRYRDFRLCAAPTATAALWLARAASADVLQWRATGRQLGGAAVGGDALAARRAGVIAGSRVTDHRRLRAVAERRFRSSSGALLFARARSSVRPRVDLRAEFKRPGAWSSTRRARARKASTAPSSSRRSSSCSTSSLRSFGRRQAQIGSLEHRIRASASAADGRKLRFARADSRSRSLAASHRGSIGAQRFAGSGRRIADE